VLASLIALVAPPRCLACTANVAPGRPLCRECRAQMPWLAARDGPVFSPVAYEGPARALVHALKFHGRIAAAGVMAAQIAANAPPGLLAGTLVPVPAHPGRRRQRGFDQARTLARELARRADVPVLDALSRAGSGGRQATAGRQARLRQDLGIAARRPVAGPVVLVDDVVTTGATLRACARALGNDGMTAVTYARTSGQHALRFP
jgi:ComF family protein